MKIVGVGVDIENVSSFRKKKSAMSDRFFRRVFSKSEIRYCKSKPDPAAHFAARFCAKESVVKAAEAVARLLVSDIEVQVKGNGAPTVKVWSKRKPASHFFSRHEVLISLSHTKDRAIAFALVVKK